MWRIFEFFGLSRLTIFLFLLLLPLLWQFATDMLVDITKLWLVKVVSIVVRRKIWNLHQATLNSIYQAKITYHPRE